MEGVAKPRWNTEMVLAHDERLPSPRERLLARSIDQGLIAAFAAAVLIPGLALELFPLTLIGGTTLLVGWYVYDAVSIAIWGKTIGKRIRGLRVARLADGRKPDVAQSVLRALVLPMAGWAEYSVVLNRAHRGPHDRAAKTIVVYDSRD